MSMGEFCFVSYSLFHGFAFSNKWASQSRVNCRSFRFQTSSRRVTVAVSNQVSDTNSKNPILVVGAGIIGLTTAICLKEAGYPVSIIAEETPSTILQSAQTGNKSLSKGTYTSSGSGGLWMPFVLEGDNVKKWASSTYKILEKDAKKQVGVRMLEGFVVRATSRPTLPWYASLANMSIVTPEEDERVPKKYHSALRFIVPIVQMEVYLPYLEERARKLNLEIELTHDHREISENRKWNLANVTRFAKQKFGSDTIIVNCTGIGAERISGEKMIPGRGVTVRVKRPSHLNYFISEDKDDGIESKNGLLAYAIPRGDEYTLGGTFFPGDWNEEASEDEVITLKKRCNSLLRNIEHAEEVSRWTGLRPVRASGMARVEVDEKVDCDLKVIANYGHGGSGVTVSWGCAEQVLNIINE